MKRFISILFFAALLLSACNNQPKGPSLEAAPEPSWFTNPTYFAEKNGLYVELPIDSASIVMLGDDYMDRAEWYLMFGNENIKNRGIALDGTEHIRYRIDQIASSHPAKIFISAGTRDILHGESAENVAARALEIIERAITLSPSTQLTYISVIPTRNMDEAQVAAVGQINSSLAEAAKDGKFTYIDVASQLAGADGKIAETYSWDGIVLNGAGYELYAKAIEGPMGSAALNKANDKKYPEITPYYKHRVSMFNSLPDTYNKIMMLGNSLNNNAPWNELFPLGYVINRGISGDVVEGIYNRLDDVIAEKPNKIFLMTATNDFINNPDVKVSTVWKSYDKLIKKIRKELPYAVLYVQSVLPLNPMSKFYEGFNAKAAELNKLLEADASANGYAYLDIASILSDENGDLKAEYTTDGIHLSADGYFVWAAELAKGQRMLVTGDPYLK